MNPDGVSYLDISDHFLRGGLSDPQNGYWSPLYPAILALIRRILGEGPGVEFQLVHLANFLIFLAALGACELLLRALARKWAWKHATIPTVVETGQDQQESWLFVFGYLLFTWMALSVVTLGVVTPDMLVMAAVLTAAALIVRIARGDPTWWTFTALGAVLGLGYLAKAVMFPAGIIFIAVAALISRRVGAPRAAPLVSLGLFVLIAMPHIITVSRLKGAPTFGETGRLNHAWFVARTPTAFIPGYDFPATASIDPDKGVSRDTLGAPVSTARLINIDAPIPGTIPLWYDATFWYRGSAYSFTIRQQIAALRRNGADLLPFIFAFLATAAIVLVGAPVRAARVVRIEWGIVVPGVLVIGLYLLVYVEGRYVAPFVILIVLGCLAEPFMEAAKSRTEIASPLQVRLRNAFLLVVAVQASIAARHVLGDAREGRPREQQAVARTVTEQAGEYARVAIIGNPYPAAWARLARSRVVAFVPTPDAGAYWKAGAAGRRAISDSLRSLGVVLIVADGAAKALRTDTAGWVSVPGAPNYLVGRP